MLSVAESLKSESKPQSASVTDKNKKTSSSTNESDQSQSRKQQKQKLSSSHNRNGLTSEKKKSEQDLQDNGLASEAHGDDQSILETKSQEQKLSQPSSSQEASSTQLKEELPPVSTNPEETEKTNPEPTDSTEREETDSTETEGAVKLESRYLFQAIGLIRGQVISTTKKLKIEIDGRRFELKPAALSYKKKLFQSLRTEILATGAKDKTLLVYPHILEVANQPHTQKIIFKLVDTKKLHYWSELEPGEFILSGIWEYIPNTEQTAITIRRNSTPDLVNCLKKLPKTVKKTITQPIYLPCEWSEPTVKPFQYREDVPKKELKRYFVQTHAKFIPESSSFNIIKQLAKPTRRIPTYIK